MALVWLGIRPHNLAAISTQRNLSMLAVGGMQHHVIAMVIRGQRTFVTVAAESPSPYKRIFSSSIMNNTDTSLIDPSRPRSPVYFKERILAAYRENNWDLVYQTFLEVRQRVNEFVPAPEVYQIMLLTCAKRKDAQLAHKVFKEYFIMYPKSVRSSDCKEYLEAISLSNQPPTEEFALLQEMHHLNIPRTKHIYNLVLAKCILQSHWSLRRKAVQQVWSLLQKEKAITPSGFAFYTILPSLQGIVQRRRAAQRAIQVLQYEDVNNAPWVDRAALMLANAEMRSASAKDLFFGLCSSFKIEKARCLAAESAFLRTPTKEANTEVNVLEMKQRKFSNTLKTLAITLMHTSSSKDRLPLAIQVWEHFPFQPNQGMYNMFMHACYRQMKESNKSIINFNPRLQEAIKFYSTLLPEILGRPRPLNARLYTTLAQLVRQSQNQNSSVEDIQRAMTMLEQIVQRVHNDGLTVPPILARTIFRMCAVWQPAPNAPKGTKLNYVLPLLDEIKAVGFKLDIFDYSALFLCCVTEIPRPNQLSSDREFQHEKLQIKPKSLFILDPRLNEILEQMRLDGVKHRSSSYEILMKVLSKCGQTKSLVSFWRETAQQTTFSRTIKMDAYALTYAASRFDSNRMANEEEHVALACDVLKTYIEMGMNSVKPVPMTSVKMFGSLLLLTKIAEDPDLADMIFLAWRQRKHPAQLFAERLNVPFESRIARLRRTALAALHNDEATKYILSVYLRVCRVNRMRLIFQYFKDNNIECSVMNFAHAFDRLAQADATEDLLWLLTQLNPTTSYWLKTSHAVASLGIVQVTLDAFNYKEASEWLSAVRICNTVQLCERFCDLADRIIQAAERDLSNPQTSPFKQIEARQALQNVLRVPWSDCLATPSELKQAQLLVQEPQSQPLSSS